MNPELCEAVWVVATMQTLDRYRIANQWDKIVDTLRILPQSFFDFVNLKNCITNSLVYRGNVEGLRLCIARGIDVNEHGFGNGALLSTASRSPSSSAIMVNMLLDAGARIDEQGCFGCTPLIVAIISRNSEAARVLIRRGANPNIVDARGYRAIDYDRSLGTVQPRPKTVKTPNTVVPPAA